MSRPLPYAHPPEDYIPTLQKLLSNPPVTPEPILKSHNLTAEFTKVTMLIDPINGFPPGYDLGTWLSYYFQYQDVKNKRKAMVPCCFWYGSVTNPWDDRFGKKSLMNGNERYLAMTPNITHSHQNYVQNNYSNFKEPISAGLRRSERQPSQSLFSNWVKDALLNGADCGYRESEDYDEKYFVLFVVWKRTQESSIMLLHDRITALEKNNSKELLVQLETTDELTKFLVQAKVQTHEEGLRREGFCEVDDLVDAEDKDLVDAGLKITEIRRIRRYLSKPKLDPFGDVFGDVPIAVAAAAAAEDTSLSAQEQEMKENK